MSKPEIVAGFLIPGVISNMGGVSVHIGSKGLAATVLLLSLISAFCIFTLIIAAMAGTETGEFCPTCPDWTNLDGWLAQKEAYERAQMDSQSSQQNAIPATGQTNESATVRPAAASAGYARSDLLTRPEDLDGQGIVLDVRSEDDYRAGHISGARNIYWKSLLKSDSLDLSLAEAALGSAGIEEGQRVIICGGSDEGGPFVFWALSYLGHKNLSLLDGGIAAARKAGVAMSTNAPAPSPTNYSGSILPRLLVIPASLESVLAQSDVRILDGREFSDYGQGRLGNESICLSLDKIYDGHSRVKDAGILKDLFERRLDPEATVIVYGTPQAYSLFYSLCLMGYNATLIQGDWWKETAWAIKNIN